MKRLVSALLTLVLLVTSFTVLPMTYVEAEDGTGTGNTLTVDDVAEKEYISDSDTINGWKEYFTPLSTEYAGAVWTDKAVFTANDSSMKTGQTEIPDDFKNLNKTVVKVENGNVVRDEYGNVVMTETAGTNISVEDGNFLVSLSALAATKQITGYSALPSDTVIILDLSNSMGSEEMYAMVESTNKAIAELFELNHHNRVGVVVYATNAYELLPIDRYTTTATAVDDNGTPFNTSDDTTYPAYIELNNFSAGNSSNTGQIRAVRTSGIVETTITVNLSVIDENEWNDVTNAASSVNNGGRGYWNRVGQAVRDALIDAGVTFPEGLTLNWGEIAQNKPSNQTWKDYLSNALKNIQQSSNVVTYHVKDSLGNDETTSINVGGATYIQGGLSVAKSMFLNMDTTIATGLVQGGTRRIPIVVLMTDGAPTYATTNYTNPTNDNRNLGNGGSSSITDDLVFPTQLTAAHVTKSIEDYYQNDSLFYSLGLGVGTSGEALRVLNPEYNTNNTIDEYWDGYVEASKNNPRIDEYKERTINKQEFGEDSLVNENKSYRHYTDEYFSAEDADDLIQAFDNIVETIIIQSKYYPTLVEEGKINLDGYITFEDELGEFVKVKEIEGMVLENKIFTGDAFLTALQSGAFGNASTWTAYGNELLNSISERLNIAENEARTLLATAWRAEGQLQSKNYIGWYADSTGNYLGHWDDKNHTEENYPADAAYLNKCYIFQGTLNESFDSVKGADMMHIIVQVHEEISTGRQCVIWKIPASLVPLATYEISIDTNSLENAKDIHLDLEVTDPIRLLYEVTVDESINSINLNEVVGSSSHNHPVTISETDNTVVGYAFYSNRWGDGHTLDGSGNTDVLDPNDHLATVSHFNPSKANERYYYTENAIVYTDQNGTKLINQTSETLSGDGYYHIYRIFEAIDEEGNAKITEKYVPIDSEVLKTAVKNDDGTWYIPAGQIYKQIARHRVLKSENITETLEYYDYPVVSFPEGNNESYHIYDFLGNNGRLVMYSAQGIKLTKVIDDASKTGTFGFDVLLKRLTEVPVSLKVVDDDNTPVAYSTNVTADGVLIEVSVSNNETIYIIGVPTDTEYIVSEDYNDSYRVSNVTVDGKAEEGKTASDTIEQYVLDDVVFTNTESSHMGNLEVSKTVTHPYGDKYEIASTLSFEVLVTLTGNDIANKTFTADGTVNNGQAITSVSTDANGQFTVHLGHEDSFTIINLPEGTGYTVSEPRIAEPWVNTSSTGLTGTIVSDGTVHSHLINHLDKITESDVGGIDIQITKNIMPSMDWKDDWSFEFMVEKYDEATHTWNPISTTGTFIATKSQKTVTIPGTNASVSFGASDVGKTFYYRVSEVKGALSGVTYDETHRYFMIQITDVNTDGILEVSVENYSGTEVVINEGKSTVNVTFTNYYASAATYVQVGKNLKNETGIEIPMSTFTFELCSENHKGTDHPDGATHLPATLTPNANGELMFPLVYRESDLDLINVSWMFEGAEVTGTEVPEGATKTVEFTYYLWENKDASNQAMIYDDKVYTVNVAVTVTKQAEGENAISAVATVVDGETFHDKTGVAVFNNKYELDPVGTATKITGTKNLDGRDIVAGEFTFNLYETHSDFKYSQENLVKTVSADARGSFEFNLPEAVGQSEDKGFQKAGQYYFVITETKGTNTAITYDESEYHVTIVVGNSNGDKQLDVESVTVNKVGGDVSTEPKVTFNNAYTLSKFASITLHGDKELDGKVINADEFTFGLYTDEACTIPVVDANNAPITAKAAEGSGAFSFGPFEYKNTDGAVYYIKEIAPEGLNEEYKDSNGNVIGVMEYSSTVIKAVVTVEDDKAGTLNASVKYYIDGKEDTPVITNTYIPKPITVSFNGTKKYLDDGDNPFSMDYWPEDGFEFELYEVKDDSFKMTDAVLVATQEKIKPVSSELTSAKFEFSLTYDKAGTHYYVLREKEEISQSVRFDTNEYHITVVVTDYGDGKLVSSYTVKLNNTDAKDKISFTNRHIEQYTDVDVVINKIFENNTGVDIPMNMFRFGLYEDEACTVPYLVDGVHVESSADTYGDATISMRFSSKDLVAGTNLTKTLYVKEIPSAVLEYEIDYDESVYKIIVNIKYVDGVLTSEVVYPNAPVGMTSTDAEGNEPTSVTFTNEYVLDATDAKVALSGTKVLEGREIVAGEFEFELYNATVIVDPETNQEIWTVGSLVDEAVQNKDTEADTDILANEFELPELTYSQVGTYHYIIKESNAGTVANGITYDSTEYRVTVVTVPGDTNDDEVKNELVVENVIIEKVTVAGTETVQDIVFTNTYEPEGEINPEDPDPENNDATFELTVSKTLEGREWLANDKFTFELYWAKENDNKLIATEVVKDASGNPYQVVVDSEAKAAEGVAFAPVKVNKADTYHLIVKEKEIGSATTKMEYDSSEYWITAVATDTDLDGILEVNVTRYQHVVDGLPEAEEPTKTEFVNTYNPTDATVIFNGTKVLTTSGDVGRDLNDYDGKFEWGLFESDSTGVLMSNTPIYSAKNDKGEFEIIATFDKSGDYYFVLMEVKGNIPTITYDTRRIPVHISVDHDYDHNQLVATTEYFVDNEWTLAELFDEDDIIITNEFTPTEVAIHIKKVLEFTSNGTHGLSGFQFNLKDEESGENFVALSDSEGNAEFVLQFNEEHAGKVFKFVVSELDQKEKDMVYDTNETVIELEVKVNAEGMLIAALTGSDSPVTDIAVAFTNTYKGSEDVPEEPVEPTDPVPVVPNTGDNSNLPLYGGMMTISVLLMAILVVLRKKKELVSKRV